MGGVRREEVSSSKSAQSPLQFHRYSSRGPRNNFDGDRTRRMSIKTRRGSSRRAVFPRQLSDRVADAIHGPLCNSTRRASAARVHYAADRSCSREVDIVFFDAGRSAPVAHLQSLEGIETRRPLLKLSTGRPPLHAFEKSIRSVRLPRVARHPPSPTVWPSSSFFVRCSSTLSPWQFSGATGGSERRFPVTPTIKSQCSGKGGGQRSSGARTSGTMLYIPRTKLVTGAANLEAPKMKRPARSDRLRSPRGQQRRAGRD